MTRAVPALLLLTAVAVLAVPVDAQAAPAVAGGHYALAAPPEVTDVLEAGWSVTACTPPVQPATVQAALPGATGLDLAALVTPLQQLLLSLEERTRPRGLLAELATGGRCPNEMGLPGTAVEAEKLPLSLGGGVTVYFYNPYFIRFNERRDAATGLNTDTTDDLSLGILGSLSSRLRAAAYSTLDVSRIRPGGGAQEDATHRFTLGLDLRLNRAVSLGWGAGAVVRSARGAWEPSFYLDFRVSL